MILSKLIDVFFINETTIVGPTDEARSALAQLCAPLADSKGALRHCLNVLRNMIAQQNQVVMVLLREDQRDARTLYGAFAARKLLEATTVALLARLDPPAYESRSVIAKSLIW